MLNVRCRTSCVYDIVRTYDIVGGKNPDGNRTAELIDREDAQHGSRQASSVRSSRPAALQSKMDRVALHRDLIVGMELQKKDPGVSDYQKGQVLYKQPAETPDERRFRIFGTHEYIGSGPYGKDGSWIQWARGKPFKAPTHAEVRTFLKDRDRRIAALKSRRGLSRSSVRNIVQAVAVERTL